MLLENSSSYRSFCWRMEDGDIEESGYLFAIIFTKMSFSFSVNSTSLSLTDIQDKYISLIGFQCYTMCSGHRGRAFLRMFSKE